MRSSHFLWLVGALSACQPRPRGADITYHVDVRVVDGGYAHLSVGDTLTFQVDSSRCYGDVCDSTPLDAGSFEWSISPAELATVDQPSRTVRALKPGVAVLTARRGDREVSDSVHIYSHVARLEWEPRPRATAVGDTLRVSIVARDPVGREVARIPAHSIGGGTGTAGQLLDWGGNASGAGPGPTTVWLDRPGTLTLIARLAHRWDTLALSVTP